MNKKVLSFALSSIMILATASTAFAANADVYTKADGKMFAEAGVVALDEDTAAEIAMNQNKYLYEYGEKYYTMEDANAAFNAGGNKLDNFATEIAKKTPVGDVSSDIKSVTGLTDTVSTTGAEVLEFAINGNAQAAKLADLIKAGYTVTFKATSNVFANGGQNSTDGIVKSLTADTSFEYRVVIEKANETGVLKEVARSAAKTVKVKDYTKAVTEITSMEVVLGNGIVVSSGKLASEAAIVKVMGRTKDMNANDKPVVITSKAAITSSDKTSATISTVGAVTVSAKTPTNVTFTATAGNLTQSITLNVGNETRVLSNKSIVSPTSVKLATGGSVTVTVTTKDQYGDPFQVANLNTVTCAAVKTAAPVVTLAACTGSTAGKLSTDGKTASSTVTITAESASITKELTGTAALYDSANPEKVVIGTVKVTVAPKGAIETWKLVNTSTAGIANDFVLDMNGTSTSAIHAEGYDKAGTPTGTLAITTGALTTNGWTLKSNDEKIATVTAGAVNATVSAVKAGSTTIVLIDNIDQTIATLTLTVKDSAPLIQTATWTTVNGINDDTTTVVLKDVLTVTATENGEVATVANFDTDVIKVDATTIGGILVKLDNLTNKPTIGPITGGTITFTSTGAYNGTATIYVVDKNGNEVGSDVTVNVVFTK